MALPKLYSKFIDQGVVTVAEVIQYLGNQTNAYLQLHHLAKKGYFIRIKQGLYGIVPIEYIRKNFVPDKFVIASKLVSPYAIAYHSALELHGIAHSMFNEVSIIAKKFIKPFEFQHINFVCHLTKYWFGMTTCIRSGLILNITDIERTILDGLRTPAKMGGIDELLFSLEGLRGSDILSAILEYFIKNNSLPAAKKFRADFEKQRDEIDWLLSAGLISEHQLLSSKVYSLTLAGLKYCNHQLVHNELNSLKKIFDVLRFIYKEEPGKKIKIDELSKKAGLTIDETKRALIHISSENIFDSIRRDTTTGLIIEYEPGERILDYIDSSDLISRAMVRSPSNSKFSLHELNMVSINFDKFIDYLDKFNQASLYARAGFLLSLYAEQWKVPPEIFIKLSKKITNQKFYFPEKSPKKEGKLLKKWNIIIPRRFFDRYPQLIKMDTEITA